MQKIYERIKSWEQRHYLISELIVAIVMLLVTVVVTIGFGAYYISKSATINSPIYEMDATQYKIWANTIETVREKPGAYLSTDE